MRGLARRLTTTASLTHYLPGPRECIVCLSTATSLISTRQTIQIISSVGFVFNRLEVPLFVVYYASTPSNWFTCAVNCEITN